VTLGWVMLAVAFVGVALAASRVHLVLGCLSAATLALAWINGLGTIRRWTDGRGRAPSVGESVFLVAACFLEAIPVVAAATFGFAVIAVLFVSADPSSGLLAGIGVVAGLVGAVFVGRGMSRIR
jgi:hypothetical protein